jgi:membrane protein implicated in regulation of membrane protease activity
MKITLLSFTTWWADKDLFEQIYWAFAIPSTLLFMMTLIMTFVGGAITEMGDADAAIEGDEGIGFQFFTLKGLIGFFTLFSWSGLACIAGGVAPVVTVVISIVCGLLMMIILASIFYFMSKLTESGSLKLKNAIGRIGEVYIPIKAKRGAIGQIQINIQGSVRTLQALTDDEEDLGSGSVVQVNSIINDQILLVTKNSK